MVLDSVYVYKGVMEWSVKWRRHWWRRSTGEVGHNGLWEAILRFCETGAGDAQMQWVPLHLNVYGNEEADALPSLGRGLRPNNMLPLSQRRRVTE